MNTATITLIAVGVMCACAGFVGGAFFVAWLNTGGDAR